MTFRRFFPVPVMLVVSIWGQGCAKGDAPEAAATTEAPTTRAKGEEGDLGAKKDKAAEESPVAADPAKAGPITATAAPAAPAVAAQANDGLFGPQGATGGGGAAPGYGIGHGSPAPAPRALKPASAESKMRGAPAPVTIPLGGAQAAKGIPEVAPVDAPARAPQPKLDPNARYATTYRPGGAALAAFDASVQKGDIPAEYKDLVGDFGSRYAPQMDAPKEQALSFRTDLERSRVAPAGGLLNFRIAIRSSAVETKRAPLSVHLVLDVSGSMSGAAIDNARKAAASLVERLDPADDFSLVTFSSSAEVRVPDGPVGARRKQILSTIAEVQANGGTNISSGLDLGYAEAHKPGISKDAVKIVMLLSDGHANGGDTNPKSLAERSARAFQDGIQTSSFGLGADFDAPLMSSIADRGAGGYYYLADSTQIAGALAKEMDSRLVPAALGVEVRVRLRPDIAPVRVYGSRALDQTEAAQVRAQEVAMDKNAEKKGIKRDRQEDAVGGMRFFMPAFAKDDRHAILMQVEVPPGTGERPFATVEVKYKDRIRKKNVTDELSVKLEYAKDDAESARSAEPSVVATAQAFLAGDSIVAAERLVDGQNRLAAMRLLQERAELLKRAAVTLNEARLGEDALRLARLSRAVGGPGQVKDALPLAVLLRGSSYGYLK